MSDDRPDRPSRPPGYRPVPGLLDIDAIEDANVADAFGEDEDLGTAGDGPQTAEPGAQTTDGGPQATAGRPDPLGPPPPPPLDDAAPAHVPIEAIGAVSTGDLADQATQQAEKAAGASDMTLEPVDASAERSGTAEEPSEATDERFSAADEPIDVATEPFGEADAPFGAAAKPFDAADERSSPPSPSPPPLPLAPAPEVMETAKTATRSRGRELVQLVLRYGKAHVPEQPAKAAVPDTGPPRMVGRVGQLIPFLRVIPWVLAALFALSFWWDFDGQAVSVLGRAIPVDGLLRVLSVSGLIGFGTNWLAITMLFQPREKRAIIPQGLIPAQRERVIYRLSEAISRELINADIIKQRIQESGVIGHYRDLALGVVRGVVEDPGFRADLKSLAQDYATEVLGSQAVRREVARLAVEKVEEQAGQGFGGVALKLYRTFAEDDFQRRVDRALDELPGAVVPLLDRIDTALDEVPAKVEARADEIEEAATRAVLSFVEGFDVRTMIAERARQFDEGQLEGLLKSTSNEQLNYIKYLGAILGVVGGFVIWQPLGALAVLTTLALALWATDEALVRTRSPPH